MAFFSFLLFLTTGTLISILIRKLLKGVMLIELKNRRRLGIIPQKGQATFLRRYFFWLTVLGGGLAFLFTKRPMFGLLGLAFGALLARHTWRILERRKWFLYEEGVLSLFLTLSGMIRSGLSLPLSLQLISEREQSGVTQHVARYLNRFGRGQSVKEVLGSFVARSQLKLSGNSIGFLGLAQQEGFEILPLLEKLTLTLQTDLQTEKQLLSLKAQVSVQALIAFILPWGMLVFLSFFQSEILGEFFGSIFGVGMVLFCLCLQGLGGWVLWQVSLFR